MTTFAPQKKIKAQLAEGLRFFINIAEWSSW